MGFLRLPTKSHVREGDPMTSGQARRVLDRLRSDGRILREAAKSLLATFDRGFSAYRLSASPGTGRLDVLVLSGAA